jgi:hypothetical protein
LTVGPAPNVQSRVDWVFRFPFAVYPQAEHSRLVFRGIDHKQKNSSARCFVLQKETKLVEGPTSQNCTLLFPNHYSFVDPSQFFNRDSSLSAFGFGNDLLRNAMVDVCGKARFPATQSLQLALGAARTSHSKR